jgi:hypothetical protein
VLVEKWAPRSSDGLPSASNLPIFLAYGFLLPRAGLGSAVERRIVSPADRKRLRILHHAQRARSLRVLFCIAVPDLLCDRDEKGREQRGKHPNRFRVSVFFLLVLQTMEPQHNTSTPSVLFLLLSLIF